MPHPDPAALIDAGAVCLGIELGSTQVKACLVEASTPSHVLATGTHRWENAFVGGRWTYPLDEVWTALRSAYGHLRAQVGERYGTSVRTLASMGVSAMMHGYLAFDGSGRLLVPFRTWRNTSTGPASRELSALFGVNIPLRWSIAHLHQAILDDEPHVSQIARLSTLAGCVHHALTGRHVAGVGDASGMFPIDVATGDYDQTLADRYDERVARTRLGRGIRDLLPQVLPAGEDAGALTETGAVLLDGSRMLQPGAPLCPPEGDAGTGMVATCAVAPRTGNVSVGTSIFASVVLERPMDGVHDEIDVVATPAGRPVAMVHANSGASEVAGWVGLFARFAQAAGAPQSDDDVYRTLFVEALAGAADAGGILAYNQLAGEPVVGLAQGRPLVVRAPDADFTLANVMRAQLYGVFATLASGMRILADEGVELERMFAHGGLFRTAGVAGRMLAAALDAPVSVAETAPEGGAWGAAVLAAFTADRAAGAACGGLEPYLRERVFAGSAFTTSEPVAEDVAGFSAYLDRYRAGLDVVRAAAGAVGVREDQ